ncbi:MAG TPA: S8 family peptidase, partial [Acetivibrio sp.]|nr:S8 family peptidase [Acetivibrio sp.]
MFKKMGRKVCVFALAGIMTLNIGMQTTFAYSNIPAKLSLENTANLLEKNADKEKEKYVKGELIVKYKSTKTDKGKVKDKIKKSLKKSLKKKSVVPQEKEELSSVIDVLEVDENEDIDSLAKSISEDPDVEFAQPNYIYYASAIPQDERYSEQWSLKNPSTGFDINAEKAWDITRGSSNVVVAVLDTGIAIGHPDLAGNIYVNPDEIIDNDDNDGNDKDDDLNGWDFVNDDNTVYDLNDKTHGTHVAGTIAASANNIGVSGVAPNVKILPLKVLGTDGRGSTSGLVKAIEYAASKGAEIVNMSLGGPDYDPALIDIMNRNPQTLFVVAAGNDHCDLSKVPTYPASHDLPNMLVVASVDPNGSMSSYSNYGDAVDVAAPGRDILSTVASYENENIEYSYGLLDGTSMAAPHVTGVAALVKSRYPDADAAEIINRIKGSASINEDIKNWVPGGLMLDAYGSINNLGSIDFTVSKASENEIYLEWMPVPGAASYKCS